MQLHHFCTQPPTTRNYSPPCPPVQHARHLGGEGSAAATAAARSLALLLLHPAPAPRAAAAAAAATVSSASPELAALLVAGLQHWASNAGAAEVAAVLGDAPSPQQRFAVASVAAAPAAGSVQLSASLISSILLLAHHPTVAGSSAASSGAAWAAVARKLGPVGDVLAAAPADVASVLVSSPVSGAACPQRAQQAAACGALAAAMALAAGPLFDALMEALGPLLDTAAHDALNARETKIYFTPAGGWANLGGLGWMGWVVQCLWHRPWQRKSAFFCAVQYCAVTDCLLFLYFYTADKLSFENDDGTIMAEEIFQQQLLSYRPIPPPTKLPDCPDEQQPAAAAAAAEHAASDAPSTAPSAAASKPSGAGRGSSAAAGGRGGGRGAAAPKSSAAAEARLKQLAGEAEVRAKVVAVRDGLTRGLRALAALATGDRAFTAEQVGWRRLAVFGCGVAVAWPGQVLAAFCLQGGGWVGGGHPLP